MEGNCSTDLGVGVGFRMIQARYFYHVPCFYYYISGPSRIIRHQIDFRGWGTLLYHHPSVGPGFFVCFFPITLEWKSQLGLNLGVEDRLVNPWLTLSRFFLHVHARLPWISRSGHQNTHAKKKKNPAQGSQSPSCGPLPASSLQHSIVKAGRNSITSLAKLGTHLTSLD